MTVRAGVLPLRILTIHTLALYHGEGHAKLSRTLAAVSPAVQF